MKVTTPNTQYRFLTSAGIVAAQYVSDSQGNPLYDEDGFMMYVNVAGMQEGA